MKALLHGPVLCFALTQGHFSLAPSDAEDRGGDGQDSLGRPCFWKWVYPSISNGLLGLLIFFDTPILPKPTVKLSQVLYLPVSNVPVKVLLLALPRQLCGFYTGVQFSESQNHENI